MKTLTVLVALVALSVPAGAAGRCAPLLTDARGDVQETGTNPPYPVEDVRQVDLLSVDLASTAKTITATFTVASLDPESQPLEAHLYSVGFSTEGQRYYLDARHDAGADSYSVRRLLTGRDAPEDMLVPASSSEDVADATGTYSTKRGVITVTAPRSVFATTGGLSGAVTSIRATTYAGARVPGAEVYEFADHGRTDRSHRVGTPGCR